MTSQQKNASRVRGQALVRALELSRSGDIIDSVRAQELWKELGGQRAMYHGGATYHTSGGAVVTFTPFPETCNQWYRVSVSASPI